MVSDGNNQMVVVQAGGRGGKFSGWPDMYDRETSAEWDTFHDFVPGQWYDGGGMRNEGHGRVSWTKGTGL